MIFIWCRVEFYNYDRENYSPCELSIPTVGEVEEFWSARNIIVTNHKKEEYERSQKLIDSKLKPFLITIFDHEDDGSLVESKL